MFPTQFLYKEVSNNFICFFISYDFCVVALRMHNKLFINVFRWNVWDFLRLLMMPFKHGLTLYKCSLIMRVLFLLLSLSDSAWLWKSPTAICLKISSSWSKKLLISLILLYSIALITLFSDFFSFLISSVTFELHCWHVLFYCSSRLCLF